MTISEARLIKNSETDVGFQPEDQKSKATSHWLLPPSQFENGDPDSQNPQNETETDSCLFPFYNPL